MRITNVTLTSEGMVGTDFSRFPLLTSELREECFNQRRKLASGPRPVLAWLPTFP